MPAAQLLAALHRGFLFHPSVSRHKAFLQAAKLQKGPSSAVIARQLASLFLLNCFAVRACKLLAPQNSTSAA